MANRQHGEEWNMPGRAVAATHLLDAAYGIVRHKPDWLVAREEAEAERIELMRE